MFTAGGIPGWDGSDPRDVIIPPGRLQDRTVVSEYDKIVLS
jgi:hypothetical protein